MKTKKVEPTIEQEETKEPVSQAQNGVVIVKLDQFSPKDIWDYLKKNFPQKILASAIALLTEREYLVYDPESENDIDSMAHYLEHAHGYYIYTDDQQAKAWNVNPTETHNLKDSELEEALAEAFQKHDYRLTDLIRNL